MHPVQPYNENTHVGHDGQLAPQQRSNEAVYWSIAMDLYREECRISVISGRRF
ncbi:hypothetical protein JI435_404000 [Parastagonospora nodorum SN15]|uniref:Uncharacterized protein n=1 Tax=Phaeosphaeria nodorum (strain SN15 / ATCC MYA-4574 / FGSC 10173) TaxID=321614 RepID=A0A7U2EVD6_PHANO|nr:hypothetical protein JI435_404000 [Parastagonospora nodorum SN15]